MLVIRFLWNVLLIAVNVGAQSYYSAPADRVPTASEYFAAKLTRKNYESCPKFFSIILRLTSIASSSKLEKELQHANILLHPPVSSYNMKDMEQIAGIVKTEYIYAVSQMDEIKTSIGY